MENLFVPPRFLFPVIGYFVAISDGVFKRHVSTDPQARVETGYFGGGK